MAKSVKECINEICVEYEWGTLDSLIFFEKDRNKILSIIELGIEKFEMQ